MRQRTFHPRAQLKPDLEYVGYVGIPEEWLSDQAAVSGFERVAVARVEQQVRAERFEVLGSSGAQVVRCLFPENPANLFPGGYADAVKVTVRCRK